MFLKFILGPRRYETRRRACLGKRPSLFSLPVVKNVWTTKLFCVFNLFLGSQVLSCSFFISYLAQENLKFSVFLKLLKELLRMGTSLRARPCSDVLANHIPVLTEHFETIHKFSVFFISPLSFINSFLSRSVIFLFFIFLFLLVLKPFKLWVSILKLTWCVAFVIQIYPYRV